MSEVHPITFRLKAFNAWRRGNEAPQPDPKTVGEDIDSICDIAKRLERERDEWKQKFIQQNKDLGCEMMDPGGTIWDYAKKLQADIAGWETKWKCAVDMAAKAENQLELANRLEGENAVAYLRRWAKSNERAIKAERERDEALSYADKLAAGLPDGMPPKDVEVLRDANLALAVERDSLQEQLDAAIMLGKMQERRHERDLEELIAAAKAVIDRWETPFWKEAEHTGAYIAALRKAVERLLQS